MPPSCIKWKAPSRRPAPSGGASTGSHQRSQGVELASDRRAAGPRQPGPRRLLVPPAQRTPGAHGSRGGAADAGELAEAPSDRTRQLCRHWSKRAADGVCAHSSGYRPRSEEATRAPQYTIELVKTQKEPQTSSEGYLYTPGEHATPKLHQEQDINSHTHRALGARGPPTRYW